MIKLNEQEMDKAIDRAIEKFCDDYVPLYGGPCNINMPGGGYVVPYYAKSTLRSLCVRLIAELCVAESEKFEGESNPDHVKCPHCGHIGIEWDREHDWYCPDCGNYVEYKD